MHPGAVVALSQITPLGVAEFRQGVLDAVAQGERISALFAADAPSGGPVHLYAVLTDDSQSLLRVGRMNIATDSYPSLTADCAQAHWFEREIAEQFGILPEGHPWLKPVRYPRTHRPGRDAGRLSEREAPSIGEMEYFQIHGDEVHEVAVGPVHAGVIEPGHFRFQCHGEQVFHLEISLGYQHRGVEGRLIGGPNKRTVHYLETAAGDTSIGHVTAYCQIVEALARCAVPIRAQALRGLALELERLANHVGDLGALAGDVGFLPTQSFCGRLRGDFLNLTAMLCGSRFGRGLVRSGGVTFDADGLRTEQLRERLDLAYRDVSDAVRLFWESSSAQARLEDTGRVSRAACDELGLVGPAARACGADRDIRRDFPCGIYRFSQIPVATWHTGDVFARAYVRWLEIQRSVGFVRDQLTSLPAGEVRQPVGGLAPNHLCTSLVEGWRGEICHVALTDEQGRIARYKIVDPSFHNWFGLAIAMRDEQISDFPLCNKSFNLSYCGVDL
jgi:Ni,Fe-hydrogenase III large subunit